MPDFNGPALAAEAARRLQIADYAVRAANANTGDTFYDDDQNPLHTAETLHAYATHLRETATVLAQLAHTAAVLGQPFDGRPADDDEQWGMALGKFPTGAGEL